MVRSFADFQPFCGKDDVDDPVIERSLAEY